MTRRSPIATVAAALFALALPAVSSAELPEGAKAPDFKTQGALAGKTFAFSLHDALRRGPVVLYFYPKSFTQGCTLEAHAFADATEDFKAAGATVIGMSNDDLPTLQRFSTAECRDKFAVGVATPDIIRAYDVPLKLPPAIAARVANLPNDRPNRTSYVIAPDGRIKLVYSNLDYRDHVRLTLDAVRALSKPH
ncbi:MAG: peroxiredoxin [Novosphingobium sp.]|nr:peroxiredoxin [Novosphingobium sp.]